MTTKKPTSKKANKPVKPAVAQSNSPALPDGPLSDEDKLFWVGIGASAGGLEALRSFVSKMPTQSGHKVTYIVAQHLSPKHQSMLVQLLSRETDMNVQELEDGQKPEAGIMYITPPNSDVFVENGTLRLSAPMSDFSPKPSVDYFFSTLAEDRKDRAIGVILSGTGSDGSHGVRAIRAAGGMTIAQDTTTAKFDGMPGNAISSGCIDVVLPAEKIGPQILSIIDSPLNLEMLQEEVQRTDIQELLFLLKERCGVDFKDYKTGTLYRRINRRMAACATADLDEYLDYIDKNVTELDELYSDILISVTDFFRDDEAFDALRETIRGIIKEKATGDEIRVWVPGCATGEEAYSIVMLFAEALGGIRELSDYNFQLFASDIDTNALAKARKGAYPEATLKDVPHELRDRYFRHRENTYEISKAVRDYVVFSRHNIFEDPPFLRLDLISCRNLLIYFNTKLQATVMNLFHYAMLPNATLFLGKSESLGHSDNLFQPLEKKAKIFRRKFITNADHKGFAKSTYTATRRIETPNAVVSGKTIHDLPDAIIQALAPDSLLIDESMDVIRVYGDVAPYTQLSAGSASMNLMSLAKKDFRQELRALVYKVLRENTVETILPKKMKIGSAHHQVRIIIRPLTVKNGPETLLLISFEKAKKIQEPKAASERTTQDDHPVIAELEQELTSTREHLQTVVEELETSNEELQSTNEELQSSNEELQSSNEELETSNEELQSTNEELLTVNEELQTKTHELTISNEDLNNVRDSVDFPLLVVNKELKLKLFNNAAKSIFMIEGHGVNEVITSIGLHIDIPDLRANTLSVINSGEPFTRQLDFEDVSYYERIIPYRNDDGSIDGAVFAYINNTKMRRIERKLEESEERYHLAVKGASVGLWDWQVQEDSLYCSTKLLQLLQVEKKDFKGNFDFLRDRIHPDDKEDVLAILDAHLQKGFEFNVECRLRVGSSNAKPVKKRSGDYLWAHIRGQAMWDSNNKAVRMSGSLDGTTDRRLMIDQLRDSNEALERFAYVCSHDLKEPARLAHSFAVLLSKAYKDQLDERGNQFIKHIEQGTQRMQDMVLAMLHYSQFDNKGASLTQVDCNNELQKVVENLAMVIEEKDAQVTWAELPEVKADRMQMFQLFQNLVSNSLKFCKGKKPKVHIDFTDNDEEWCFSVKDNGIGMQEKHSRQIFDVFHRLHSDNEYPGTGIGLSVCQKIVERHGGKIWVQSMPDKGATFFFTIRKHLVRR